MLEVKPTCAAVRCCFTTRTWTSGVFRSPVLTVPSSIEVSTSSGSSRSRDRFVHFHLHWYCILLELVNCCMMQTAGSVGHNRTMLSLALGCHWGQINSPWSWPWARVLVNIPGLRLVEFLIVNDLWLLCCCIVSQKWFRASFSFLIDRLSYLLTNWLRQVALTVSLTIG